MNQLSIALFALLALALAGCVAEDAPRAVSQPTTAPQPTAPSTSPSTGAGYDSGQAVPPQLTPLPDLGPAPDIKNDVWINSDPLDLEALRGRVVLVEFWTFGCVNCQRVIPHMRDWYEAYQDEAFEIVAVHYPEFSYEEDVDNVRDAVERYEIDYPVAIDNEGLTWRAYQQRYWPTRYLLDRNGRIRYKHIGEGAYDETAAHIEALLAEK